MPLDLWSPAVGASLRRPLPVVDPHRHTAIAYIVALPAVALAAVFHLLVIARNGTQPAPVIFLIPIILGACLGGLWPGLGSTLFAALCGLYFLFRPLSSFSRPLPADIIGLGSLIFGGILISVMGERLHRVRREQASGVTAGRDAHAQAQIELRESEERFHVLIEQASDAIFLHDQDGRLSVVNKHACESLGYSREELLSMTATDVEVDFDLAAAQAEWNRIGAGETHTVYGHHRRKDGTCFPVEVRLSRCEIRGRRYYLGLARDITERRRAEQELQDLNALLEDRVAERTRELTAANQELESFSYSVSHDLRAPLRAVEGFARAMAEDYGPVLDRQGQDYLNRVIGAAGRMSQLIDDLLSLSRISQSDLERHPVDASSMARAIAEDLAGSQPERAVEFEIEQDISLCADPRLLRVLLENLLGNAFKFTSKTPVARICFGASREPGESPVCFVRDNGAGFDMQYAGRLFGAFQRLHPEGEFPGAGIGLAIVQRIVNRHCGRVWAEACPQEGATFYFLLDGQPTPAACADDRQLPADCPPRMN